VTTDFFREFSVARFGMVERHAVKLWVFRRVDRWKMQPDIIAMPNSIIKCRLRLLLTSFVLVSISGRAGFLDTLNKYATNSTVTNLIGTHVLTTNSDGVVSSNSTATSSSQVTNSASSPDGLSQDQLAGGIKEALGKGLQNAIAQLGHENGFLTNLNVKIPMPERIKTIEKTLRSLKQQKLADDFVITMNHAAEQAVPEAASVFSDAVKQLSITDAKNILTGPNDAATQFFRRVTETNLYNRFLPIVQKATTEKGVTSTYKKMMNAVSGSNNAFAKTLGGLLGPDAVDVDAYVTNKALDGLFKMVAEEEAKIRANPAARTSELLQKVFGAVQK
jgi:hypothetical protein